MNRYGWKNKKNTGEKVSPVRNGWSDFWKSNSGGKVELCRVAGCCANAIDGAHFNKLGDKESK